MLAAGVAFALGVAAVGVHASAGAGLRNGGVATGWAVLLGVGFALAAATVAAQYRGHMRETEPAGPAHERLRQATVAVLFASAVLVPFALILLHKPGDSQPNDGDPDFGPLPRRVQPTLTQHAVPTRGATPGHLSFDLAAFVWALLAALVVVLLIALAVVFYRMMRKPPPSAALDAAPPTAGADADAEEEALADALLAGRLALDGDDARAAIIAGYAAMEQSLGRAGIARERSDSPSDLLNRAMRRDLPAATSQSAAKLTELFREARFSTHPMTSAHIGAARRALDEVTALLAERIRSREAERSAAKAGAP